VTLDEADKIIAELNICYPNKNLLVEEVVRWEENLSMYDYDDARIAVKHIENTSKYWPSWAEFREAIHPMYQQRLREIERARQALEPPREISEEERARSKEIIKQLNKRWNR
jgi:hypothetical protein